MLSRQSLIMSVVLVIAYISLDVLQENINAEYRSVKIFVDHINRELDRELDNYERVLKSVTRKSKPINSIYDEYQEEQKMISTLTEHSSLAMSTKGRKILKVYGLSVADLNQPRHIRRQIVSRKSIARVSILLEELSDDDIIDSKIVSLDTLDTYLIGQEYEIELGLLSKWSDGQVQTRYDLGDGYQIMEKGPLVFENKPDFLTTEVTRTNHATGEKKTYKNQIFP